MECLESGFVGYFFRVSFLGQVAERTRLHVRHYVYGGSGCVRIIGESFVVYAQRGSALDALVPLIGMASAVLSRLQVFAVRPEKEYVQLLDLALGLGLGIGGAGDDFLARHAFRDHRKPEAASVSGAARCGILPFRTSRHAQRRDGQQR